MALPSTNVTNELTFSQMKAFHQHGQSDEALDQHLAYRLNIMHALNLERRELNKHRTDSTKAADSPEQLLMDITQLIDVILPRYTIYAREHDWDAGEELVPGLSYQRDSSECS